MAKKMHDKWTKEIQLAKKRVRKYQRRGNKIVRRYIDDRGLYDTEDANRANAERFFRLNLFHTNISTLSAMLYGRLPKVDVSRRYHDANDDVARVASLILQRMLNNSVQEQSDGLSTTLKTSLLDRLLPGMGVARIRYEMATTTEEVTVAEVDPETGEETLTTIEQEKLDWEDSPIDYIHWDDVLWGWGRTYQEIPWWAYASYLTEDEVTERFGKKAATEVTYEKVKAKQEDVVPLQDEHKDVEEKAQIWEIWCKESNKVYWYNKGASRILDTQDDPLELEEFFPQPPPMIANPTTSLYMPTADFYIAQNLYDEIDILETRIAIITRAVKVVGVYDQSAEGVSRMLTEGVDNDLIPVENWAMFGEKGGLQGVIDWFPVDEIAMTLTKLQEMRTEAINLLYQVTGMSDIIRGGGTEARESATAQALKAKFASIRVQALQDEFAGFASNLMTLRAEIISKFYEPATIIQQSGIMNTPDAIYAQQAVQLIKNWRAAAWRIEIKPESVAMIDYAQLKSERTEFLTAMATFMQSSAPLIERNQGATPFLMEMLKWAMAGFKGSQEIEGVVDRAIDAVNKELERQQQQPPEKPVELQREEMRQEGRMRELQLKGQIDQQQETQKQQAEMMKEQAKAIADLRKINEELRADLIKIRAQLTGDVTRDMVNVEGNIREIRAKETASVTE